MLDKINNYFTQKVKEHGAAPKGVDWNSVESQEIRFQQICKIIDTNGHFSLLDFGCGYGALLDYLKRSHTSFSYTGYDINPEMIETAAKTHHDMNAVWTSKLPDDTIFDYIVSSGIFNYKLEIDNATWKDHIINTITTMNKLCRKGFSFNLLTSYSDKEYMKNELYYADPTFFFDYCKRNFSKQVALLHDYQIYDFTILVRK